MPVVAPRFLTSLLLLSNCVLPGCCVTYDLWTDDDDELVPVLVADTVAESTVQCALAADAGLLLLPSSPSSSASSAPPAGSAFRLVGKAGAELAVALLLAGEPFRVEAVRAEIVNEETIGRDSSSAASLAIHVRVDPQAFVRRLDPTALPAATLAALAAAAERARSPDPGERRERWGRALSQCCERLRLADYSALVGSASQPVVVAMVVVDEALLVPTAPPAADEPEAAGESLPLRETLLELGAASVLVEASDGQRRHLLLLRADLAWLWTSLEPGAPGQFVHHSEWDAIAVADEPAPPLQWPAGLSVRDLRFELQPDGLTVWQRLALTPFTLTIDLAGAWLLSLLGVEGICGDDDDEDEDSGEADAFAGGST